jgi:translation initiation factor IF-2
LETVIAGFGPRGELPSPLPLPLPLPFFSPARGSPGARRGPRPPGARRRPSPAPSRERPLRMAPLARGDTPPPAFSVRRCPSPASWRGAAPPGPGPSGAAPWRPCARPLGPGARPRPRPPGVAPGARPLPPDSVVPGAAPVRRAALVPGSAAPHGSPSAFPHAQPQHAWRSNLGLISF